MKFRNMNIIVSTFVIVAVLSLGGLYSHEAAARDNFKRSNFGERVAGLYFVTESTTGAQHLITLWDDGNFQSISSIQEGGAGFNPFSDQMGTWKKTGRREITAKVIDMTYNFDPMTLFGFGVARYVLTFDKNFKRITGTTEGGVISADDKPTDLDAEFLFTFGSPLEGERVPVRFPEGFPNQ